MQGFKANRDLPIGIYKLKEVFHGLEKSPAVQGLFGDNGLANGVLEKVVVEIHPIRPSYMRVSDEDGRIVVGKRHLQDGDDVTLYLDAVHELTHVKQFWEGKELFDKKYEYVDRPTEIEAFRSAVLEALRLGLDEKTIREYLKTEWMTEEDLEKLIRNIGLNLRDADPSR